MSLLLITLSLLLTSLSLLLTTFSFPLTTFSFSSIDFSRSPHTSSPCKSSLPSNTLAPLPNTPSAASSPTSPRSRSNAFSPRTTSSCRRRNSANSPSPPLRSPTFSSRNAVFASSARSCDTNSPLSCANCAMSSWRCAAASPWLVAASNNSSHTPRSCSDDPNNRHRAFPAGVVVTCRFRPAMRAERIRFSRSSACLRACSSGKIPVSSVATST